MATVTLSMKVSTCYKLDHTGQRGSGDASQSLVLCQKQSFNDALACCCLCVTINVHIVRVLLMSAVVVLQTAAAATGCVPSVELHMLISCSQGSVLHYEPSLTDNIAEKTAAGTGHRAAVHNQRQAACRKPWTGTPAFCSSLAAQLVDWRSCQLKSKGWQRLAVTNCGQFGDNIQSMGVTLSQRCITHCQL
jgi:hypothetical protein